jgi:preprotein translocase subunit SecA
VMLDHLSKVIGWRGLAQRDPLNEYKQEAFELFQTLLTNMREQTVRQLSHVALQIRRPQVQAPDLSKLSEIHVDPTTGENDAESDVTGTSGGPAFRPERTPNRPLPASITSALGIGAPGPNGNGAGVATADPRLKPIDPALLKGVSRNAPCPCGSGKKFKHCHGSF